MDQTAFHEGLLIVLSGPSGVGKGTIVSNLMKNDPNIVLSVSATTRQPRLGEQDGRDYFFRTRAEFEEMMASGKLLEWDEYCGNFYGTPKDFITKTVNEGKDVVLEITVEGAMAVKRAFPEAVTVFILPPSFDALKHRIMNRNTEKPEIIEGRLGEAIGEIKSASNYEYLIVNDSVDEACELLRAVISAEKAKATRNTAIINSWREIK